MGASQHIFPPERGIWKCGETSECLSHLLWWGSPSTSLFLPENQLLNPNSVSKEAPQAAELVPSLLSESYRELHKPWLVWHENNLQPRWAAAGSEQRLDWTPGVSFQLLSFNKMTSGKERQCPTPPFPHAPWQENASVWLDSVVLPQQESRENSVCAGLAGNRTIEWFEWKRTFKVHLVQSPCRDIFNQVRLLRVLPSLILNISRDGSSHHTWLQIKDWNQAHTPEQPLPVFHHPHS